MRTEHIVNEGVSSRAADTVYAFRFVRLLVTKWEKTQAYKLGILDNSGKVLKKPETTAEKASYTYFHRLVFNIKRLVQKIPFGKSALASWATALFLLKEHANLTDKELEEAMDSVVDFDFDNLKENTDSWIQSQGRLSPGAYTLINDIMHPKTAEFIGTAGTQVVAEEFIEPSGFVFATPIYEVTHTLTKQKLYISIGDIKR